MCCSPITRDPLIDELTDKMRRRRADAHCVLKTTGRRADVPLIDHSDVLSYILIFYSSLCICGRV